MGKNACVYMTPFNGHRPNTRPATGDFLGPLIANENRITAPNSSLNEQRTIGDHWYPHSLESQNLHKPTASQAKNKGLIFESMSWKIHFAVLLTARSFGGVPVGNKNG